MSEIITVVRDNETIFKCIATSMMVFYRNNELEIMESLVRFGNEYDMISAGPMLEHLIDQSLTNTRNLVNQSVDNTFHTADLELTVCSNGQHLVSSEKVSNLVVVALEVVGTNSVIPRIELFNIDNHNSWSYVYSMSTKHLEIYHSKIGAKEISSGVIKPVTADDIKL